MALSHFDASDDLDSTRTISDPLTDGWEPLPLPFLEDESDEPLRFQLVWLKTEDPLPFVICPVLAAGLLTSCQSKAFCSHLASIGHTNAIPSRHRPIPFLHQLAMLRWSWLLGNIFVLKLSSSSWSTSAWPRPNNQEVAKKVKAWTLVWVIRIAFRLTFT